MSMNIGFQQVKLESNPRDLWMEHCGASPMKLPQVVFERRSLK